MRAEGVDAAKSPVDTLYWMREAELKHGRVAQLAGGLLSHTIACIISDVLQSNSSRHPACHELLQELSI